MEEYSEALGVDVGTKRIGLARVNKVARLPEPICTIANDDLVVEKIHVIAQEYNSDRLVVGLPRNLSGEDTKQTVFSREFADKLNMLGIKITLQDEALSSKQAEKLIREGIFRINARGEKVGVDEVAACIILNDFIGESI